MVDLRDGRDRALATAPARPLLDCDRRRNPENGVHIGPRRGLDELSGVGIKRFQITTLSFCKEDIERECALAATAYARNDNEFVARDANIDVLEVVLARLVDAYRAVGLRPVQLR